VSDLFPGEASVPVGKNAAGVTECDVWRWIEVDVNDTFHSEDRLRCVECKLPVRLHRAAVNGMAAHFEHLKRNPKCSRSDAS
jgi:hypothetical protein